MASWLHIINPSVANQGPFNNHPTVFLTAVDPHGQVIASIGTHAVLPGILIQTQLSTQNRANLRAVLTDRKGTMSTITQEADGTLLAITPIVGQEGNVQGALIMKIVRPDIFQLVSAFLQLIVVTVVIVTTIAAIAGMVFGYLTARGLTRRLKGLTTAADRWGRGDFSALAHDASEDELGYVARQFNRMAEQLQNLLQARQKLATLEERNRLARDLHDSVKQQIFAVAMQIGATKVLLKRDVNAAEVRLNEAQKLVNQAQQELTSLIRELRPAALEGKGLVKATLVQIILTTTGETVTLSVADNGQGFDTARSEHPGVGLLSMQERMRALGGDVEVESTPGKGTRITAHCKRLGVGTGDIIAAPDDEDAQDRTPGDSHRRQAKIADGA